MPRSTSSEVPLQQRLSLVYWFARQLGFENNADMLAKLRDAREGYGEAGSYLLEHLLSSVAQPKIPHQLLRKMDDDIRSDLERINSGRQKPSITMDELSREPSVSGEHYTDMTLLLLFPDYRHKVFNAIG